jgi:hypothetical protein
MCDFNTHKSDFHPHSVILHAECVFHMQECNFDNNESLRHGWVWFIHTEYNFYTQSVISTRTSVNSARTRLVSARIVRFLHAECAFYTQGTKLDTYVCTRSSVNPTRSVISESMNEIPTRTSVFSTRRVWIYMQSVVSTHTRVVLTPHEYDNK